MFRIWQQKSYFILIQYDNLFCEDYTVEIKLKYHNIFSSEAKVTKVEAVDYDDPNEGTHAVLSYSLEKNVIDEKSGRPIFTIHPKTGL